MIDYMSDYDLQESAVTSHEVFASLSTLILYFLKHFYKSCTKYPHGLSYTRGICGFIYHFGYLI